MQARDEGFYKLVREVEARLQHLNADGSFAGVVSQFGRLVGNLPANFCKAEVVTTADADDENPTIIIRPGPELEAIAAALRALDFHELPPSPDTFRVKRLAA
jgi:hypothetical protein